MIPQPYLNESSVICLITTTEVDFGIRSLSSFLKDRGRQVVLGFFNSRGLYTEAELKNIRVWVRAINSAVIGISSLECSRAKACQLITALRGEGRIIVVGGADATLNPGYYLDYADFVIRGEAEEALAEFVAAVLSGKDSVDIANVCYRTKEGNTIENCVRPLIENIDTIPHEDFLDIDHHYELLKGEVHRKTGFVQTLEDPLIPYAASICLFTIRGCYFNCSFCGSAQSQQLNPREINVRKRSIRHVIERVEQLRSAEPSTEMVYFFEDDFFFRTLDEIKEFSAAWKNRIDLPFYVHASPNTLNEDKLKELLAAGLVLISVGIQTGSSRINNELYHRNVSNEATVQASVLLHRYIGSGKFGLAMPCYSFIINNPYETRDDLLQTIFLFQTLPKPYYVKTPSLELFQGTKLFLKAIVDGKITGIDETTKYNFHDTLRHFKYLIHRGGDYYLNSLLYWMNGFHTKERYGIVFRVLLNVLIKPYWIDFFNRNPLFVTILNHVLPTHIRTQNIKMKLLRMQM